MTTENLPTAEQIADIVRDHLTAAYVCNRVWEAWSYNTMGPDDFIEASETDMADEIAAAIVERLSQQRNEAIAWINEYDLPDGYPHDDMFTFSEVHDGVRMFPVFWPETVITTGYLDGHRDGLEWSARLAEANHPLTGDWLHDDPHDLAKAIRKGPEMPPADPVKCDGNHGGPRCADPECWNDSPVEPSDADLFAVHDEFFPTMVMGHDNYLRFARALLGRFGVRNDKITASEAIYGFAGWLTTRSQAVTFGSTHDCAPIAELVDQFVRHQGLTPPRERYADLLRVFPLEPTDSPANLSEIPNSSGQPQRDADMIEWVADRIVNVYGEPAGVDFVLALRRISAKLATLQ